MDGPGIEKGKIPEQKGEMKTVTAAILVKDGRVLIARRRSTDRLAGKWEFPGGTIEEGETPEACLKREMKEEFDIDVTVGDCLGESVYHYPHGAVRLLAYATRWRDGQMTMRAHDDYRWVPPHHLNRYDLAPADIPLAREVMNHEW